MNKIFQLCFMFSQEIYIKLETLASRKIEFLPVLKIFFFLSPCMNVECDNLSETKIQDQRFSDNDNNWLFLCNYHRANKPKLSPQFTLRLTVWHLAPCLPCWLREELKES